MLSRDVKVVALQGARAFLVNACELQDMAELLVILVDFAIELDYSPPTLLVYHNQHPAVLSLARIFDIREVVIFCYSPPLYAHLLRLIR